MSQSLFEACCFIVIVFCVWDFLCVVRDAARKHATKEFGDVYAFRKVLQNMSYKVETERKKERKQNDTLAA